MVKLICYIVGFVSLLARNLTTLWQLCCRPARYHLRLRGVRNNKIKQDVVSKPGLEPTTHPQAGRPPENGWSKLVCCNHP